MIYSFIRLNKKLSDSLRKDGVKKTASKLARFVLQTDKIQNRWHARSLRQDSRLEIFTKIYKFNYWGSSESVSGSGSTVELTANLRHELPKLFAKFEIGSVYDAPCGDFNWMRTLMKEINFSYCGADIVPDLIQVNIDKFKSENIEFKFADITSDAFPKVDLWICRDCLFHLSYKDIYSALENYVRSDIPFVLTSTHINTVAFENKNILTGGFRLIDLFEKPFCFHFEPLYRIADWVPPHSQREMCLWSRDQIAAVLPKFRQLAGF
jgi:hypothetical protein